MKTFNMVIKTMITVLAASLALPVAASATLTARANHDHITVNSFYHGSEVSVRGVCDPGTDVIVMISNEDGHIALKKKDKVGGILWMNVGDETFEHVPDVYMLRSTGEIANILDDDAQAENVIGYPALEKHAEIEPVADEQEKAKVFGEFLKFKEASHLYSSSTGGFDLGEKDGVQTYFTQFDWPYQAKPGDYKVTVYAVKDKKVIESATADVKVEQVGAVKMLSGMAKNNSALYGMLSVIIALAAGFGVGIVFKGGGAH